MNWTFEAGKGDVMHHACSKRGLQGIGDILAKCWSASAALMPDTADMGNS